MSERPTVDTLRQFLREDDVVAQVMREAGRVAGVPPAAEDLLVVESEDVARLGRLGLLGLADLREAFRVQEPAVARLLAAWRSDSESPITPQELLWALTYVLAVGDGAGDPTARVRALVAGERWWQRVTDLHQARFLESTVTQVAVAMQPDADASGGT